MKTDINIAKNFNLNNITLDLSKELNYAGDIIVKDHVARLERGQDANEKQMKPLAESTIKAKGFNQILVEKDKMRHLVRTKASASKQSVTIKPGDKEKRKGGLTNIEIAAFHQEGGPNLPKREWFGISRKAEKKAMDMVEKRIDKMIKNA
tara:strand:- start:442 stop:891 length:450 start_codon:yes stop_codon:yes gene_type:complete